MPINELRSTENMHYHKCNVDLRLPRLDLHTLLYHKKKDYGNEVMTIIFQAK
jgi:hypothetical protein